MLLQLILTRIWLVKEIQMFILQQNIMININNGIIFIWLIQEMKEKQLAYFLQKMIDKLNYQIMLIIILQNILRFIQERIHFIKDIMGLSHKLHSLLVKMLTILNSKQVRHQKFLKHQSYLKENVLMDNHKLAIFKVLENKLLTLR